LFEDGNTKFHHEIDDEDAKQCDAAQCIDRSDALGFRQQCALLRFAGVRLVLWLALCLPQLDGFPNHAV